LVSFTNDPPSAKNPLQAGATKPMGRTGFSVEAKNISNDTLAQRLEAAIHDE